MGKFVDVEVIVTSTVVYRLPRPTKAEVVELLGDDAWDKDDPEGSIQEYLESQDIDDLIQGHRPVSVVVDDKEIEAVYPSEKGSRPLEASWGEPEPAEGGGAQPRKSKKKKEEIVTVTRRQDAETLDKRPITMKELFPKEFWRV